MVGHSFGGLLARVYAHRFNGEVVGLVLVDSAHPLQNWRVARVKVASRAPPPSPVLMKLRPVVAKFLSRTGVTRLTTGRPEDPPVAYARTSLSAMHAEGQAFVESCAEAAHTGKLGDLPLVVLTAGQRFRMPGLSGEAQNAFHDTRFVLQAELAKLSENSEQRVSPRAGHYIQLDDPDAVVSAIVDVVTAARQGTRLRKPVLALNAEAGLAPAHRPRRVLAPRPSSQEPHQEPVNVAVARPPEAP